jgi:hypothetical protein
VSRIFFASIAHDETPKLFADPDHFGFVTIRGCMLPGLHRKRLWANSNSFTVAFATACGLRYPLGRQDSHARQGGTKRDIVLAENSGWIVTEDASHLHADALHL